MRAALLALLAVLAAGTLAPAASAASPLIVGVGDQKPDMFDDPLFEELDIRHARLAVSWDALNHPWQTHEIDIWLDGARRAGVQPLVGFWHARTNRRKAPTPEQLKYQFRRFRERYPWVTTFATWNEANHCSEPTCNRPQLVAAYWRALRKECRKCRILAAEVLDMPNLRRWVRAFRRKAKVEPRYWGLHNYVDANRFRTAGTRTLIRNTKGRIWFTETGGIVKRRTKVRVPLNESSRHAAKATRWVFDKLVPLSSRIDRVYLYHWNSKGRKPSWDSGLLDRLGRPRPALKVLRKELRAARAAQRRAAARRR